MLTATILTLIGFLIGKIIVGAAIDGIEWLRKRRAEKRREEQCCGCNNRARNFHTVTTTFRDETEVGMEGGRTSVSAEFCKRCCPGNCDKGCQ